MTFNDRDLNDTTPSKHTEKRQKTREKQQKRGGFDANSVKNTL